MYTTYTQTADNPAACFTYLLHIRRPEVVILDYLHTETVCAVNGQRVLEKSTLHKLPKGKKCKSIVAHVFAMKKQRGKDIAALILNLGTRWKQLVNFKPH
jgi:hypothetical protein